MMLPRVVPQGNEEESNDINGLEGYKLVNQEYSYSALQ